jgi:dienelactone hydrolase
MKILRDAASFAALLLFGLSATSATAAGFRMIEVPADGNDPAITGAIWYPCAAPAGEVALDRLTIAGTPDCPIEGEDLPLVVISHGSLGAWFDHHDTAAALADAGFVVAAISHRGDNIPTLPDAADPSVMFERPYAIKRLIDFMLSASPAASRIDGGRIGFFGFSAGGATGLELLGADPYWAVYLCRFSPAIQACASMMGKAFEVKPHHVEPRIQAAVLADPPAIWLVPDSLAKVRAPVQLWASADGGRNLPRFHGRAGERGRSRQALAGSARISRGAELVAFRVHPVWAVDQHGYRLMHRRARLRPRRLSCAVQCRGGAVLPQPTRASLIAARIHFPTRVRSASSCRMTHAPLPARPPRTAAEYRWTQAKALAFIEALA